MARVNDSIVLDTPEQIQAYRYLATLHGLRLELRAREHGWDPKATPTRGMALASARRILESHDVPKPYKTRRQCLALMRQLCLDLGLTTEESK